MNKLRPTIKLALFISVASLFFAACSDDDDKSIPVPEPSRMITVCLRAYGAEFEAIACKKAEKPISTQSATKKQ